MGWSFLEIALGLIPAAIAQSKGLSLVAWWTDGALLFIVALPHLLLINDDQQETEGRHRTEGMKKWPRCAEMIKVYVKVCRYADENSSTLDHQRPLTSGKIKAEFGM